MMYFSYCHESYCYTIYSNRTITYNEDFAYIICSGGFRERARGYSLLSPVYLRECKRMDVLIQKQ